MSHVHEIEVRTGAQAELIDVTRRVDDLLREAGGGAMSVTVYVPHTTAAVTINENADPTVRHDMLAQLDQMVPWSQPFYRHGEGNSAAHVKASLLGSSVTIPVQGGRMALGTWQGIYFAEFDGPRTRRMFVQIATDG